MNIVRNGITIKISKQSQPSSFVKKGEVIVMNAARKYKYAIVLNDSEDSNVTDEELGDAMQSTFTLRPLSKFKPIRFIQIKYYRTKFYIQKLKSKSKT